MILFLFGLINNKMESFPENFNYESIKQRLIEQEKITQKELLCKCREKFVQTINTCINTNVFRVFYKIPDNLNANYRHILIRDIAKIFKNVECKEYGQDSFFYTDTQNPSNFAECSAIYINLNEMMNESIGNILFDT